MFIFAIRLRWRLPTTDYCTPRGLRKCFFCISSPQSKRQNVENNPCARAGVWYSQPITETKRNEMSATLQAPQGGQLHNLSDKFYKGGQFMPEPDRMAGVKRKAREAAGMIEVFSRPEIGSPINGKIPVRVTPRGWTQPKVMLWVKTNAEAIAARDEFRAAIEARVGAVNWARCD